LTLSGQSGNAAFINNGELVVGENQPYGQLTISGETTDKNGKTVTGAAVVVVINPDSTSIKEKFSVDPKLTGAEAVDKAFRELSAFIEDGGLTNPETENVINLGDYIELEAGLFVEPYPGDDGEGGGKIEYKPEDPRWTGEITASNYSMGSMNRLIVVGINSFKDNGNYKYPKGSNEPDPSDHVVFQFDNVMAYRRMNPTNFNEGGYPASELRKYLTPVDGDPESGNFLAGLTNAGVPEEVLWGPERTISTKGNTTTIDDLLWLPTQWEIYGKATDALNEDEGIQVKLAYYGRGGKNESLVSFLKASNTLYYFPKFNNATQITDASYWLASVPEDWGFRMMWGNGSQPVSGLVTDNHSVVPAFCVYGLKPQQ
jgi:hypothetical protein